MAGLSTNLVHADDSLERVPDVVQPINITTTFKYSDDPEELVIAKEIDDTKISTGRPVYSRLSHPNSTKCEEVLSTLLNGHVVIYNSGLSAFFAALTYYAPKVLSIGNGYHGCHGIANIFTRLNGLKQVTLDVNEIDQHIGKGDVIHLETPVNPEGIAFDIKFFADKAHSKGAFLIVDATFAPPPLQDPFLHGADMVLHSATKYFGGHSDLLAGCLVTKDPEVKYQLVRDRVYLGTNIGNLESYLLLRSLRTYEMRILKQSENATKLVKYLADNIDKYSALEKVYHASLEVDEKPFIKEQLSGGFPPVFSIIVKDPSVARQLPSKLKYFHHATSLGGVESLIEWRAMSDSKVIETLLRVSCGVENVEDMIADFDQALSSFN